MRTERAGRTGQGDLESSDDAPGPCAPRGEPSAQSYSAQRDRYATQGIPTHLGGILYLINLMHHLQLPDGFEPTWGLASGMSRWALLDLLARMLLGEARAETADDAIWTLLAEMDGRDPNLSPAEDFPGSDSYRIPEIWFADVAQDDVVLYWGTRGQRLRVWSSQGFVLTDCRRGRRPAEVQALREVQRSARSASFMRSDFDAAPIERIDRETAGPSPGLRLWLACAMPYIRMRLCAAIGLQPIPRLLHLPGRLYLTPTHLDLVAGLDDIYLPARLAGLDRDPGWVPQLGRVVSFHFR